MAHTAQMPGARAGAWQLRLTPPFWTAVGLPLLVGLVYGIWCSGLRRDEGPITTGNVMFGVVCGAIAALVAMVLHQISPALPREQRALAWAAYAGIGVGFLRSQTGTSVLDASVMPAILAGVVFLAVFYRYYTTE